MKIAYAGTPEFAVPALRGLIDAGHRPVGVWTQPDRPSGRGRKLTASPVKQLALEAEIPVHQPLNFKEPGALETLLNSKADLFVVAAYGLLLPPAIIDGFALGCVNLHASILPRWRGAAPIARAIEAGDSESALALMRMEYGLDTGAVIGESRVVIDPSDTAQDLHDQLASLGWPLLEKHWSDLEAYAPGKVQSQEGVTYAKKITKAEAQIDFTRPAQELVRHIHAFNPAPGAWCEGQLGRVKLLRASAESGSLAPGVLGDNGRVGCGDGVLVLKELQLPGGKAGPVANFLNAQKLEAGTVLGE